MSSYRFCRSDDISLLVQAYNECYRVHFPGLEPLTVERFKRLVREIDLWTSSCMVARAAGDSVAVLLATKREREALVWCVGVRPGHERQGHGRHLVGSLGRKLAILGPRHLVAELPEAWTAPRAFLEACGWRHERTYTDFVLHVPPRASETSSLVVPITLDDLVASGAFAAGAPRPWGRAAQSLLQRRERVRGLAVASDERVLAYLLFEETAPPDPRRIVALECTEAERAGLWLGALVRHFCSADERPVTFDRVHADEVDPELLRSWGFAPAAVTLGYSTEASAG